MPENNHKAPPMKFKYFIVVIGDPSQSEFVEAQTDFEVIEYVTKKHGSTEAVEIYIKLF